MKTLKRRFTKSLLELEEGEMDEIEITPFTKNFDVISIELYKELSKYLVPLEANLRKKGLREINLIFD